jgi:hypothetical protein
MTGSAVPDPAAAVFDWPLAYGAEELLNRRLESFLARNSFARILAERMRDETGTEFYEWVDHLSAAPGERAALAAAGFAEEGGAGQGRAVVQSRHG